MAKIHVVQGDITRLQVDAIVNAANSSLLGGGGVDGAIHRAAGPELLEACRKIGGCPTGEARITPGFRLPARYVIHAVGPVWRGGKHGEAELLASCYRHSLQLAADHGLKQIAFPAISTGAYGYPFEEASRIAIRTVKEWLQTHDKIEEVYFVLFSNHHYQTFLQLFQEEEASGS
ncbi:O-acetyl-ADP-ribose deacetylase [Thermoflavifilum thermophilum]|uniref:O-acetyl-ADP-ribose deacetylase (Regulator of RNase III), contains Macro domain n=1 Tax=Thermoflavifilum thermophilum TaxID=1393122 RepID=A0A1I7N0M0_9BACT|nr:O-acetyl-ADP-ribose deacetylase [Thermoflavifilum thermophilum]SFV28219.1 O-acetyl-ADP-ribose deacetylase (regulator of RNase III), contains Macro domain [Thermoflavifilum thermophilum]